MVDNPRDYYITSRYQSQRKTKTNGLDSIRCLKELQVDKF